MRPPGRDRARRAVRRVPRERRLARRCRRGRPAARRGRPAGPPPGGGRLRAGLRREDAGGAADTGAARPGGRPDAVRGPVRRARLRALHGEPAGGVRSRRAAAHRAEAARPGAGRASVGDAVRSRGGRVPLSPGAGRPLRRGAQRREPAARGAAAADPRPDRRSARPPAAGRRRGAAPAGRCALRSPDRHRGGRLGPGRHVVHDAAPPARRPLARGPFRRSRRHERDR